MAWPELRIGKLLHDTVLGPSYLNMRLCRAQHYPQSALVHETLRVVWWQLGEYDGTMKWSRILSGILKACFCRLSLKAPVPNSTAWAGPLTGRGVR